MFNVLVRLNAAASQQSYSLLSNDASLYIHYHHYSIQPIQLCLIVTSKTSQRVAAVVLGFNPFNASWSKLLLFEGFSAILL